MGGQAVVLANVPSGSFVGEISLLTGLPHNAAARATMPSRLIKYAVSLFDDVKKSPVMQLILMTMVQRLRDTEAQVQQHEKLSALGKMAAGLAHELNNPGFGEPARGDPAPANAGDAANANAQALRRPP